MKILFCQFGGLGEFAMARAFEKLGCELDTIYVKSENYDYDETLLNKFQKKISDTLPDCVFSINFLPIISKVCKVYKTLYISWIYDSPEMHLYSSAVTNPNNRIFFFDKIQ